MKKLIAYGSVSGALLALSAVPTFAQSFNWFSGYFSGPSRPPRGGGNETVEVVRSVPEIDASAGLLAVAAVLAIMVFVWERNRRAA